MLAQVGKFLVRLVRQRQTALAANSVTILEIGLYIVLLSAVSAANGMRLGKRGVFVTFFRHMWILRD